MPVKRLHTNTKIFFPEPYMVRVEYSMSLSFEEAEKRYRTATRQAYKLIQGTWGYSKLLYENVKIKNNTQILPAIGSNGMNQNTLLSALFYSDIGVVPRGYICFKDEGDALQFRLSVDATSRQVHMWPILDFTIHEYAEENES